MSLLSILGGIGQSVAGVATGNVGMITGGLSQLGIGGARSGANNNQLPQLPTLQAPTQFPTTTQTYGLTLGGVDLLSLYSKSGGTAAAPAAAGGAVPTGSPAVAPTKVSRTFSKCPRGYRLAIDGNCYPRAMVPRSLRKWKPEPRPVITRSDQKAIRRADHAKHRIIKLAREDGLYAAMHKPHTEHHTRRRK